MQITKKTDTRLVLKQNKAEKRIVAALGAVGCLGMGAFFLFSGDAEAAIFGYIFGAIGVLFLVLLFMPTVTETLILDTEEALLTLRLPRGRGRRVITVPFDQIAGVSLNERGNHSTGFYQQVDFEMTEASGKPALRLPVAISGMSQETIHGTIAAWARRNGAFPVATASD
ncbi:hypothetical protein [Gymnodinialimonas sp.]